MAAAQEDGDVFQRQVSRAIPAPSPPTRDSSTVLAESANAAWQALGSIDVHSAVIILFVLTVLVLLFLVWYVVRVSKRIQNVPAILNEREMRVMRPYPHPNDLPSVPSHFGNDLNSSISGLSGIRELSGETKRDNGVDLSRRMSAPANMTESSESAQVATGRKQLAERIAQAKRAGAASDSGILSDSRSIRSSSSATHTTDAMLRRGGGLLTAASGLSNMGTRA